MLSSCVVDFSFSFMEWGELLFSVQWKPETLHVSFYLCLLGKNIKKMPFIAFLLKMRFLL